MHATTVGVDLAKSHFELAVGDGQGAIVRRLRLSRARLGAFFANLPPALVVMEACGSAHYWARTVQALGHEVRLLPAQYARAYVRGNKTDAADAAALLEAVRCADIRPVPVKSLEQQIVQQLHRQRTQYLRTRTGRMNQLRGMLREFGVAIPQGMTRGLQAIRAALESPQSGLPQALHAVVLELLEEIESLRQRMQRIERSLNTLSGQDPIVQRLQSIPGVGLLTATALRAGVGDVQRFASGRHLSSWLGLTAREHSSGERRRLGRLSKRGDTYLRTLLVHGARAVLVAAQRAARSGRPADGLRRWALQTRARCGYNKATVALANKLARIIWASWRYERDYQSNWSAVAASP